MKSELIQYIAVFIILSLVIGWVLYSLIRKKPGGNSGCPGCAHSAGCSKKLLLGASAGRLKTDKTDSSCHCSDRLGNCDRHLSGADKRHDRGCDRTLH